jgi:putative NADH-flavin reductase
MGRAVDGFSFPGTGFVTATAVVRNLAGLVRRPDLTVITANVAAPEEIVEAVAGRDDVLTAIGSTGGGPTTVQTDTTTSIVAAMRKTGVRRLVFVSSSGIHTAGDGPVARMVVKPIVRRLLRHSFADMREPTWPTACCGA